MQATRSNVRPTKPLSTALNFPQKLLNAGGKYEIPNMLPKFGGKHDIPNRLLKSTGKNNNIIPQTRSSKFYVKIIDLAVKVYSD